MVDHQRRYGSNLCMIERQGAGAERAARTGPRAERDPQRQTPSRPERGAGRGARPPACCGRDPRTDSRANDCFFVFDDEPRKFRLGLRLRLRAGTGSSKASRWACRIHRSATWRCSARGSALVSRGERAHHRTTHRCTSPSPSMLLCRWRGFSIAAPCSTARMAPDAAPAAARIQAHAADIAAT